MPSVNRSALVPFSAEKMFHLVNDVAQYPAFLPGCEDVKILHQQDTSMEASLLISKAGVRQWFTTKNQLKPGKHIIMNLKDGPFKKLFGGWVFTELDTDACKIELNLEFEFSNRIVEMAFGKVFSSLANNMVKAFTNRAKDIYSDR
ncbi:MAG: type II toxin-antitoxin system RatA family toxin [Aestuariibacter sp.]